MVNDEPSSDVLDRLERAEQLKIEGKYTDALGILEQLLLEDPENVSALEEVADNELSLASYDRAETAAKQAIALDRAAEFELSAAELPRLRKDCVSCASVNTIETSAYLNLRPEIMRDGFSFFWNRRKKQRP